MDAVHARQREQVFRQFTTLPHRTAWGRTERDPYVGSIPDALAGLIRRFSTQMLDLGKLGFDDPDRYAVYRSAVFDARDRLLGQLADWLEFWGMVDPATQRLSDAVQQALLEG